MPTQKYADPLLPRVSAVFGAFVVCHACLMWLVLFWFAICAFRGPPKWGKVHPDDYTWHAACLCCAEPFGAVLSLAVRIMHIGCCQ
jgi:hypothetical protein